MMAASKPTSCSGTMLMSAAAAPEGASHLRTVPTDAAWLAAAAYVLPRPAPSALSGVWAVGVRNGPGVILCLM